MRCVGVAVAAAGFLCACSGCGKVHESTESATPDAGEDAMLEGGVPDAVKPDAPAGVDIPPWDPVWHKTTPAEWKPVPHGAMPDCGPGCTMLTRTGLECGMNRRPRSSDEWVVYQALAKVYALRLSDRTEWLIDDGSTVENGGGAGAATVDGQLMLYAIGGTVEHRPFTIFYVASLVTGERKALWGQFAQEVGQGPTTAAFANPYAYWDDTWGALHRFDLRDGSMRTVTVDGCSHQLSGSRTGLAVCAGAGGSVLADFDKNTVRSVASSAFSAFDGAISQDGSTIVWVDTRDPGPGGEHGTWDAPYGGEIYAVSPPNPAEVRLTFDTPQNPFFKKKTWASDEGRIVWAQDTDSAAGSNWDKWSSSGGPVWYHVPGQAPRELGFILGCPQATSLGILGTWGTSLENAGFVLVEYPVAEAAEADTGP